MSSLSLISLHLRPESRQASLRPLGIYTSSLSFRQYGSYTYYNKGYDLCRKKLVEFVQQVIASTALFFKNLLIVLQVSDCPAFILNFLSLRYRIQPVFAHPLCAVSALPQERPQMMRTVSIWRKRIVSTVRALYAQP